MKQLISTLFLLCIATFSNAQLSISKDKSQLLYKKKPVDHRKYTHIKIDEKKHYAIVTFDSLNKEMKGCYNFEGQVIIPPKYAEIDDLISINNTIHFLVSQEISPKNFKVGLFNFSGKIVLPSQFEFIDILTFQNNLQFIIADYLDSSGYMRHGYYAINGNAFEDGKNIFPAIYSDLSVVFDENRKINFVQLDIDGIKGISTTTGNSVIPIKYKSIELLQIENVSDETYFMAKDHEFSYLYNSKGVLITNEGHDEISVGFCGGNRLIAIATLCADGKTLYGFADRISGKQITQKKYSNYELIGPDYFRVQQDSSWGLVDKNGEILEPKFAHIGVFGDSGTCGVSTSEYSKMKVFLPKEDKFLEAQFDMIDEQWPYAVLTTDSCAENPLMNQLYHLQYHQMLKDTFSNYQFSHLQNTKIINGKKIKEYNNICLVAKGNQWYILKGISTVSIPGKWKQCNALSETLFTVQQNDKYGIIDIFGNVILPFEFDEIRRQNIDEILLRKNNLFGMCNEKGKIFIPIEYTSEFRFYEDFAMVKKGNESFKINRKNKRKKE